MKVIIEIPKPCALSHGVGRELLGAKGGRIYIRSAQQHMSVITEDQFERWVANRETELHTEILRGTTCTALATQRNESTPFEVEDLIEEVCLDLVNIA